MKSIVEIIRKNLKLLIRSKRSSLIVIFGPLLIIFLVGIAFDNSNTYRVSVGTFSESYNELSNSFIDKLKENQFNVVKYDSEDSCIESIKQGNVHICMTFSRDFTIGDQMNNEIVFSVDYSKINLVWMILDTISKQVSQRSSEISIGLTQDLLSRIDETKKEILGKKQTLVDLTTQNNNINNEGAAVTESLGALDLTFDAGTFKVSELSSKTSAIKDRIASLKSDVEALVNRSLTETASIRTRVDALDNVSSGKKAYITLSLDHIEADLGNISDSVKNANNLTASDYDAIIGLVNNINTNLDNTKAKLDSAAAVRLGVNTKIDSIKQAVTDSLNKVVELQNSFNKIETTLSSVKVTNAADIVSPITTTIKPVTTEKTHLNYIFPSLIVLVLMFVGILLSSTLVIMEKTSKAYFRNFVTPTKDIVFVTATYLTTMLLIGFQLVIILIVAFIFFKSLLLSSILTTIIISLLIATLFILIGMTIGYMFNSEETATLAAISTGSVFLFLSSVILPLESMPQYIMNIAKFNPFVLSEFLLRNSIIFQAGFDAMWQELLILVGYCVLLFGAILLIQRIMKNHYIEIYAKKLAPIMKKSLRKK